MELVILGSSGTYASATNPCSGYLVREEGYSLWMDAGNGTLAALQRHASIGDVDAVMLSHMHTDHCADIFAFFFGLLIEGGDERVRPVFAPPGVREKLEIFVGPDTIDKFRAMFDWHEIQPGDAFEAGPLRMESFDAAHSTPNLSVRMSAGGRSLCYSGDTGPNEHLERAAKEADVFLCEASWLDEHVGLMGPIHLTAREAGAAAAAAGPGRLLLTHIWPTNDLDVVREQASSNFDGAIELACEATVVTV